MVHVASNGGFCDAVTSFQAANRIPQRCSRPFRCLFRPHRDDLNQSLRLSSTLIAKPRSGWYFGQANTAHMKPFSWTIFIITSNHRAIVDSATGAVFPGIAFTFSIIHVDVRLAFRSITLANCTLFPCIRWTRL